MSALALKGGPSNHPKPPEESLEGVVTPTQTMPINQSIFKYFPRTVTLRWSDVRRAKSYSIETSFLTRSDWSAARQVSNILATSYTFDFVGAQKGRWRVWAVDATGHESQKSGWWEFTFTR